jgi:hypothetical protein
VRAAEIDAAYAVYDGRPLAEPDAWGDLASFSRGGCGMHEVCAALDVAVDCRH